ncbi:30S ribosomal protein S4 [Candidatus Chlorohelix sp.]|uniref:30S ribosomal protein S4 n=1 Tax=Candidatus Chlorohelix sp. TaxID=3139201 RepID=UPI00305C6405
MARYTGPVCRLCRREGVKLMLKGERCMTSKCAFESRQETPGVHGAKRQRKLSDYGTQLREKQKARRIYGVLEKQFRKHYDEARRQTGATGERLLQILELRMDNLIYRMGFADSRKQARQLVRHGHFAINGHKTDIPSYIAKIGDTVTLVERSKEKTYFKVVADSIGKHDAPSWLTLDAKGLTGRVVRLPEHAEIDSLLETNLIVEYYSR